MALVVTKTGDGERFIQPEGSAKIFLRRKDPFGFWYVSFEKGVTPDSLGSAYTTVLAAEAAIENYLMNSYTRKKAATIAAINASRE